MSESSAKGVSFVSIGLATRTVDIGAVDGRGGQVQVVGGGEEFQDANV
jgi:hypothetical protein